MKKLRHRIKKHLANVNWQKHLNLVLHNHHYPCGSLTGLWGVLELWQSLVCFLRKRAWPLSHLENRTHQSNGGGQARLAPELTHPLLQIASRKCSGNKAGVEYRGMHLEKEQTF